MILNDIECFEGPPDVLNKSAVSINTQPSVFVCVCVCARASSLEDRRFSFAVILFRSHNMYLICHHDMLYVIIMKYHE